MAGRVFILLLIVASFVFPYLVSTPTAIDDALITARYSRNLASGLSLIYNPGEKVLGTTTPLWAFLSQWIFYLPISDLGQATLLSLSAGLLGLAGIFLFCLFLGWGSANKALLFGLFLTGVPALSDSLRMGMETGLLIFLVVFLIRELTQEDPLKKKWLFIAFLSEALLLTRLDSIFVLVSFFFSYFFFYRETKKQPVVWVVLGVIAGTLTWLGWCYSYYGHYLPHSMLAKSGGFSLGDLSLSDFLFSWWDKFSELLQLGFPWPRSVKPLLSVLFPILVLSPLGWVVYRWRLFSKREKFLITSSFLYVFGYSLFFTMGKAGVFPWYAHLPSFLWFSCVVLISWLKVSEKRLGKAWLASLVVALLAIQSLVMVGFWKRGSDHKNNFLLGRYLNEQGCESLMLEPIGYLGFFSKCEKIFDLAGLVSPEVLRLRQSKKAGWFYEAANQFKPQYVVLRRGEVESNLGFNVGTLFANESERNDWKQQYQVVSPGESWEQEFELYRRTGN